MFVSMLMIMTVLVVMFAGLDDADVRLAVDLDADAGVSILGLRFAADDFAQRFADDFKIGRLSTRLTLLWDSRQNILSRLAVDRDINRDRFGVDRGDGLRGAVEQIDADAMRFVIMRQFGMMVVGTQFDNMAAVRTFLFVCVRVFRGRRIIRRWCVGCALTASAE